MPDIFAFWSECPAGETIHPRDRSVLERVGGGHGLSLDCLPGPFAGPLRSAPIVLLYLNPGLSKQDTDEATTEDGQNYNAERLRGEQPLWDADQHPSAWRWWTSRTKIFGLEKDIRFKFAFLNICPYHSKNFVDVSILASLPSCRTTIAWAQEILFREAERGERVVICMRSARYWGLREGTMRTSLFAPRVTRGGHMLTGERAAIVEAVRGAMEKA